MEVEENFKQFSLITDYSDHYYKNNPEFNNTNKELIRKIMQECKILQDCLPESIFVRAYQDRIDLLRAVIIGSAGTPYHDSLLFFDIAFPETYPKNPPMVHFHIHQKFRLNPNFYTSGYVCLSLLNTFDGGDKDDIRWDPSKSTVLQVLVSIQGLVLNDKPYYNELGYEKNRGNGPWQTYNRDVFSLCCKTMLHQLKKPVRNFEDFIASHFRKRGNGILKAIKDYLEGRAIVGYIGEVEASKIKVPNKFKEALGKHYRDLQVAFHKNNERENAGEQKRKADASTVLPGSEGKRVRGRKPQVEKDK